MLDLLVNKIKAEHRFYLSNQILQECLSSLQILYKLMITILVLLLTICQISSLNYVYKWTQTYQLVPAASKINLIKSLAISSESTFLLNINSEIYKVYADDASHYMQKISLNTTQVFFGQELSILQSTVNSQISYYYLQSNPKPTRRIENMKFSKMNLRAAYWLSSTLLLVQNENSTEYSPLIQFSTQKIQLNYVYINYTVYPQTYAILKIISISNQELLLIRRTHYSHDQSYDLVEIRNSKYQTLSSLERRWTIIDENCVRTYVRRVDDKTLEDILSFKTNNGIMKYKRTVTSSDQGVIVTQFQFITNFTDSSLNCAMNIINSQDILYFKQSSELVIRNSDIQDYFIGTTQNQFTDKIIKVKNCALQFASKNMIYSLNPNTLELTPIGTNLFSIQNISKSWRLEQNNFLRLGDKQIMVTNPLQKKWIRPNVIDCELVSQHLFILTTQLQMKVIQIKEHFDQLANYKLNYGYSIKSSRLQIGQQKNNAYCMLIVQLNNNHLINEVWRYEQSNKSLVLVYNFSKLSHTSLLINSNPSFYVQPYSSKLQFYQVNGVLGFTLQKIQYEWIKLQANILILIDKNGLCDIYDVEVHPLNQAIHVINRHQIQLDQVNSLQDSRLFLLRYPLNNHRIFFYDEKHSYLYNTLNPIKEIATLTNYKFQSKEQLLIQPVSDEETHFYYVFTNFTLVHLLYQDYQHQIYQPCDIKQIVKQCSKVSLKILRGQNQKFISFKCENKDHTIIYLYEEKEIRSCNLNNIYRSFVYHSLILDHDINLKDQLYILHRQNQRDSLDYYQIAYKKINFMDNVTRVICTSNNGHYVSYIKDGLIYVGDLIGNLQLNTQIKWSAQSYSRCAINDQGSWFIIYAYDSKAISIYRNFKFYQSYVFAQSVFTIQFREQKVIVETQSLIMVLNNIIEKINTIVKVKYSSPSSIFTTQDLIAFSSSGQRNITVCYFNGTCFGSITPFGHNYLWHLQSDGSLWLYDYNAQGSVYKWTQSLIYCSPGQYISNGKCQQCRQDCDSCQPITGSCILCAQKYDYFNEFIICLCLTIVFGVPLFIIVFILLKKKWIRWKQQRKKRKQQQQRQKQRQQQQTRQIPQPKKPQPKKPQPKRPQPRVLNDSLNFDVSRISSNQSGLNRSQNDSDQVLRPLIREQL